MKKCLILALSLLFSCLAYADNNASGKVDSNENAVVFSSNQNLQAATPSIEKGMSYKELKNIYNPKEYIRDVSDPYNSGVAGVCSFFIPGLGQIIDGEVGRGLLIMGGAAVVGAVTYGVAAGIAGNAQTDVIPAAAPVLLLVGAVGVLAIDVWSIFDAVKVAKVKNMYNQDLRKLFTDNNIDVTLSPSLAYVPMSNGLTPAAGVALRVSF